MRVILTAGVVRPEAYCVRPSVPPTVPRSSVIVLSAAPVVQPVIARVAGAGSVLASDPSLLNETDTVLVGAGAVVVAESDESAGHPKLAFHVLSALLFLVMWIVL